LFNQTEHVNFSDAIRIETSLATLHPVAPGSENDAQLIINLRSRKHGNFLKSGSHSVVDQLTYLKDYKKRFEAGEEIYFKIWDKSKNAFEGVVRLTELTSGSKYNWESLVVSETCTPMVPIDVMLAAYQFGFEYLNKKVCGPWAVDRRHERMMRIHKYIGMYNHSNSRPLDENYHWIEVKRDAYMKTVNRFRAMGFGIKEIKWS
jgi:hypothetical protein